MNFDSELGIRKCVHLKLYSDTHAGLRIELFKRKLSIQEVMETCAQLIAAEDPIMMSLLDNIAEQKREKKIKSLMQHDATTILDVIEKTGQLNSNE